MENLQPTNYCNRYEKVKRTVAGQNHFKERIPREASSRYGTGNTENETRSRQPDRKSLFLFHSLKFVFYIWDCWVIWVRLHLRCWRQTFLPCVSYSNEASQSEHVKSACTFHIESKVCRRWRTHSRRRPHASKSLICSSQKMWREEKTVHIQDVNIQKHFCVRLPCKRKVVWSDGRLSQCYAVTAFNNRHTKDCNWFQL